MWEKCSAKLIHDVFDGKLIKKNSKLSYFNVSISFDIETTSFMQNGEKRAIMYLWGMAIGGHYIYGRTWDDWLSVINELRHELELDENKRIVIYCHNLAYESAWFCHYFNFKKIIAHKKMKPISMTTDAGIEFRCSYLLSGYSLKTLAEVRLNGRIEKLVGDLDYSLKRHSETYITETEMGYLLNDIKIVYLYICDEIKRNGSICNIPLTKTGYVRRYLRENCIGERGRPGFRKPMKNRMFINWIHAMNIHSEKEYTQMRRAFVGGFTHCSCLNEGKVFRDVAMYDFTSSYPAVMLSEKFPISSSWIVDFTQIDADERESVLRDYMSKYCCIFDIHFIKIRSTIHFEHYLSVSKCSGFNDVTVDNGRLVDADQIYTTITNIDFEIIEQCYEWDSYEIANFRCFNKGYLPELFLDCVLTLYEDKTQLKGVAGREEEYQQAKENVNSLYGASVTAVLHQDYEIKDGEWTDIDMNPEESIEQYNKSHYRCMFYAWGIFITAYARRNLWTGILECRNDFIYADTDSLKIIHPERHKDYFRRYNAEIKRKVHDCLVARNLDPKRASPKTIKGESKPIGVWDYEGTAEEFKALRAKCYLYKMDGSYHLTVAGLNKHIALDYMKSIDDDVMNVFKDKMHVPKGMTGKQTHTYCNQHIEGTLVDYTGKRGHYSEESYIHLEEADYKLNLKEDYLDFIEFIRSEVMFEDGEY